MNDEPLMNMTERVLGTIEERGVAPKPAWRFLLHESVVWVIAGAALLLGSLATALTLYITKASFFIERHIAVSDVAGLFAMVPYLWLVLTGLGIFYTIHALHATRRGYRWHTSLLIGIAIGASLAVGWSIHASGASEALDRYLIAEVPVYRPLSGFQPVHWMNRPEGVVAGFVEDVSEDSFTVRAIDGDLVEVEMRDDVAVVPATLELRVGVPVRVVGTTTIEGDTELFEATEVRPFRGRGGIQVRKAIRERVREIRRSSEGTGNATGVAGER